MICENDSKSLYPVDSEDTKCRNDSSIIKTTEESESVKKWPKVGKPVKRQVPRDRIELPPKPELPAGWDGSVKAEPKK